MLLLDIRYNKYILACLKRLCLLDCCHSCISVCLFNAPVIFYAVLVKSFYVIIWKISFRCSFFSKIASNELDYLLHQPYKFQSYHDVHIIMLTSFLGFLLCLLSLRSRRKYLSQNGKVC